MQQFTEYIRQFRRFQRNARLFLLIYTLFAMANGIGIVLYPLYLSALGYGTDFIGLQVFAGTLGAGLTLVPAGISVDRFGGKPLFFCAGVLIVAGAVIHLILLTPVCFLIAAFIGGMGGAIVLVLYSPFLARNSSPAERPHLFSLTIVVGLVSIVLGEVLGGALPIFLRAHSWSIIPHLSWFLVSAPLARSYQITLLFGTLLGLPAFLPIFFITNDRPTSIRSEQRRFWFPHKGARTNPHDGKSGPSTTDLSFWLRMRSHLSSPLAVLMGVNLLLGLGAGIITPYFGLFFVQQLGGTSAQFGIVDGAARVLNAVATLLAPWIVMRIGRVATILLPRLLSLPVWLSICLFPLLPLVVILYPLRQVLSTMANGILQVFSMEVLSPERLGVANSGYQGASQVAVAISAPIGGLLIRDLGYTPVFLTTAVCYLLAMALFWLRFGGKRFVTPENMQAEPMDVTSQGLEGLVP
jgi:MFS family permease